MKSFLLVLLLFMGYFVSSARYLEDSSERHDTNEEAEDERGMAEVMDDEGNDNGVEDEDEEEKSDAREEVVKIRPGQSPEENDEEEHDSDEAGHNVDFDEDDDEMRDDRMMDGDEGGRSLAVNEEENVSDEGAFESFKRKAEEIRQENENILEKMSDLEAKFDEALSSDSHDGNAKETDLHA